MWLPFAAGFICGVLLTFLGLSVAAAFFVGGDEAPSVLELKRRHWRKDSEWP